jgi:hypothetical protein
MSRRSLVLLVLASLTATCVFVRHAWAEPASQGRYRALDLGPRSSGVHPCDSRAGGDEGSGIDKGEIFAAGPGHREEPVPDALANGHRFSCDERFVGSKVAPLRHPGVGRHAIALCEHDKVSLDQLSPGDANALAVSDDEGAGARQVAERLERTLGLSLLEEGERHDEDHEPEEHEAFATVADGHVDAAAHQEEQGHRLTHEREHIGQEPTAVRGGQLVPAVARSTREDFGGGQTRGRRGGFGCCVVCKVGHGSYWWRFWPSNW